MILRRSMHYGLYLFPRKSEDESIPRVLSLYGSMNDIDKSGRVECPSRWPGSHFCASSLTAVHFRFVNLGDDGLHLLVPAFCNHPSIRELCLLSNKVQGWWHGGEALRALLTSSLSNNLHRGFEF
jgi:hypothetical protein